jgi:hypothetical protein
MIISASIVESLTHDRRHITIDDIMDRIIDRAQSAQRQRPG